MTTSARLIGHRDVRKAPRPKRITRDVNLSMQSRELQRRERLKELRERLKNPKPR